MQMIDVISRLKEISEKSPEVANALDSATRLSANKVDEGVQITVSGSDSVLHQILKLAGMVGAEVNDAGEGDMGGMSAEPSMGAVAVSPPPAVSTDEPGLSTELGGGDDMGADLDFSDFDREMDEMDNRPYADSPDEEILPFDTAVPSGSDLHRSKGTYPKAAGGDNPMAQPTVYRR